MKERGNKSLRILDRCIGIPLVYVLSILRKKQKNAVKKPRRILVIKISGIGDTLLLMPVLKALKEADKEMALTVVAAKNNAEIFKRYPRIVDRLLVFDVLKSIREPLYFRSFVKSMNERVYDAVIDVESWSRISAIIAFFSRSIVKVGFKTKGQYKDFVFDIKTLHNGAAHESENYLVLARALLPDLPKPDSLDFPVMPEERRFISEFLGGRGLNPDKLILFHPWSAGYNGRFKEWGEANFRALAGRLIEDGYEIGIVGGAADKERASGIVSKNPARITSFCGILTIGESAALIKSSRLLVSVNSGIMHLGASLGAKIVALNGPAGKIRWGAIGKEVYNMESRCECSPCLNLGFEYRCSRGGCMDDIRVEDVYARVKDILAADVRENL